jgi:hypothetical protein
MRTWLEISPDAPPDVRESNRFAQFTITGVRYPSAKKLTLSGSVTATVVGEVLLHGRRKDGTAKVTVTAAGVGSSITSLRVNTVEPLVVGLEAHDVRPRDAFGRLAKKSLEALGSKVASQAPIELSVEAKVVR